MKENQVQNRSRRPHLLDDAQRGQISPSIVLASCPLFGLISSLISIRWSFELALRREAVDQREGVLWISLVLPKLKAEKDTGN